MRISIFGLHVGKEPRYHDAEDAPALGAGVVVVVGVVVSGLASASAFEFEFEELSLSCWRALSSPGLVHLLVKLELAACLRSRLR